MERFIDLSEEIKLEAKPDPYAHIVARYISMDQFLEIVGQIRAELWERSICSADDAIEVVNDIVYKNTKR